MFKLFAFLRLVGKFIAIMERKFYLGSAAVGAGFVAAVLAMFGVSEDVAVTISASIVGAIAAMIGRYLSDDTGNSGAVELVKVSNDLDLYLQKRAGKKVDASVVWHVKDPPMSFNEARKKGFDLGMDKEGNIYNITTGMIIGERK